MVEENPRRSAASEAAGGLRAIFVRLADFFDIFDLSFVISGAVTLGALGYWVWRAGIPVPPLPQGWFAAVAIIIASYVLGMLCFAIGRWFRTPQRWKRIGAGGANDQRFLQILQAHGLTANRAVATYLERGEVRGNARLYVRLWAEVRQSPDLAASFYLVRRYWVMAATYDGMVVALMVWMIAVLACAFGLGGNPPINMIGGFVIAAVLIGCAVACSREAGRYIENQMEELVASIAAIAAEDGKLF